MSEENVPGAVLLAVKERLGLACRCTFLKGASRTALWDAAKRCKLIREAREETQPPYSQFPNHQDAGFCSFLIPFFMWGGYHYHVQRSPLGSNWVPHVMQVRFFWDRPGNLTEESGRENWVRNHHAAGALLEAPNRQIDGSVQPSPMMECSEFQSQSLKSRSVQRRPLSSWVHGATSRSPGSGSDPFFQTYLSRAD